MACGEHLCSDSLTYYSITELLNLQVFYHLTLYNLTILHYNGFLMTCLSHMKLSVLQGLS